MKGPATMGEQSNGGGAPAPSAAALRMRRHRERRRRGLQVQAVELRVTEIDALIRRGLLSGEMRHDQRAIKAALHRFLDLTLGPSR
jgi:hypothetical protein